MSEDNRDLYRPAQPVHAKGRRCDICNAWGDHHTDRHPRDDDEPLATREEAQSVLADARKKLRQK